MLLASKYNLTYNGSNPWSKHDNYSNNYFLKEICSNVLGKKIQLFGLVKDFESTVR